jgi:methanogenic corrinoid protein MtbC1
MIDTEKLTQLAGELDEDTITEMLDQFIASNPSGDDVQKVVEACRQGMEIVGANFERGEYFVGDLIFAGELLTGVIGKLKPLMGSGGGADRGLVVLGTVEGDIHDIGKNIFRGMAEAAGFQVIDIGIDQAPAAFVSAVREHAPKIVGLSGVLTLSIESMKRTIQALKDAGFRDSLKITIGGAAVNQQVCAYTGADAWSKNAAEAVKLCLSWAQVE